MYQAMVDGTLGAMPDSPMCDDRNRVPHPATPPAEKTSPFIRRSSLLTGRLQSPAEWHVGLTVDGALGPQEQDCPCAKGNCGLAIPRAEVFCPVHQGRVEYGQAHSARDCRPPVWLRMGHRLSRLR
jgi:hypothetical protein